MVIHEQRLSHAFAFVVTSSRSNRIHVPRYDSVAMHFGITINFRSAGQQNLSTTAFSNSQHVDRTKHTRLDRLDGIELIVAGAPGRPCGRSGQLPDESAKSHRVESVQSSACPEVRYVRLLARKEVIETDDIVPFRDQSFANMGTQKSGSTGHKHAVDMSHLKVLSPSFLSPPAERGEFAVGHNACCRCEFAVG